MVFLNCGSPSATSAEIAQWNFLLTGPTSSTDMKLGLIGYDISCLQHWCELIDYKDDGKHKGDGTFSGYCGIIDSRKLDGLAFGMYWKIPKLSKNDHCIGFRGDEEGTRSGNIEACHRNYYKS